MSALSGLRDVIVDPQTRLLGAAVEAGVPLFIPSDYAIDFTKLPEGSNRFLRIAGDVQSALGLAIIATEVTHIVRIIFSTWRTILNRPGENSCAA